MERPTSVFFGKWIKLTTRLGIVALLLLSIALQAQNDAFQKFPQGVEESHYAPIAPGQGSFQGPSVMPPSWFVDLPRKTVDVLLYDKNIGDQTIKLEGKGAKILRQERLANVNYRLVRVEIDSSAKPTTVLGLVSGDGRRYSWPLLEARQPKPLAPSDLIYLIMPDRFANGDLTNDVLPSLSTKEIDRSKFLFRHGGDLQGITQQLDYIKSLGVTALWLNPVLENDQPYESYHGYAVTDHYQVDARFGGNAAYQILIDSAHAKGMKVLMDLVPNHAGDQHFLYQDMPSKNWWHLPDSLIKSNFRIPSILDPHAAPEDQAQMLNGWFDAHMPDFNQDEPLVQSYFTQLALWWIGATGQDGYRVDTYPYSNPEFMARWSQEIRDNFPTLSFFGEVWVDGLPHQAAFVPGISTSVNPGGNTAVTDFQLNWALHDALQQKPGWVDGVGKLWLILTQDYLYENPNELVTFLDNHDQTRLGTSMGGDLTKIKSALTLLYTLRGTPMLYYGTELGLEGSGGGFGEGGRVDMPGGWQGDQANAFAGLGLSPKQAELLRFTRQLGEFRRSNPQFFTGTFTHYVPEKGYYVFVRSGADGERLMVVYNSNEVDGLLNMSRFEKNFRASSSAFDVLQEVEVSLGEEAASKEGPHLALKAKEVRVLRL